MRNIKCSGAKKRIDGASVVFVVDKQLQGASRFALPFSDGETPHSGPYLRSSSPSLRLSVPVARSPREIQTRKKRAPKPRGRF